MKDIQRDEFFKDYRVPTRAKVWMHAMYSKDTDEINIRLKETDISNIKFAKSVYDGFQRTRKKTGSTLSFYCFVLSFKIKSKPPTYFKNWYLIYRHFCIRSRIDPYDLIGIEYRLLKYIAESGQETMSEEVTKRAVARLTEFPQNQTQKWKYIRDLKAMRKDFVNTKNPEEFTRKWFMSGLI